VRRKKAARKTRYTCPECATNAWAKPGDAKLMDLRRFLSISCSKHQSSEGVDRCKADARTAARAANVVTGAMFEENIGAFLKSAR
jgi:hypothetical protein